MIYLILLLPVILLIYSNIIFLKNMGEITPVEQIAREQQASSALYGSALHFFPFKHKLELLELRRPEVVAAGSSRVLQFRDSMFTKSFANLGQGINFFWEGELFFRQMLQRHRPKLVLFGLDFWWFHGKGSVPPSPVYHYDANDYLTFDKVFVPTEWVADGKISVGQYLEGLIYPVWLRSPATYGVRATFNRDGLGPDGSNYYLGTQLGLHPPEDPGFSDTLDRIATSRSQFRYCRDLNPEKVQRFRSALRVLHEEEVPTILFLIGLSPTINAKIGDMKLQYACIEKLRSYLKSSRTEGSEQLYFDFFDTRDLGASDCEFVDGFHGGEVVSIRLLLAMANAENSPIREFIDRERLSDLLELFAGSTLLLPNHSFVRKDEREIDFLGIGCVKYAPNGLIPPEPSAG